jgi:acyl-CoA synthetase (AMP-forming)/AMP-acid ligase II
MSSGPDNANVVGLLAAAAARVPERPALVMRSPGGSTACVTFDSLYEQVLRFAAGLQAQGFQPGDRAVLMVPMSIELYVAMLGVLAAGGTGVFADPWMPMRKVAEFCAFAEPVAFVGIPRSHLLRLLEGRLRRIALSITTGGRCWRIPARRSWNEVMQAEPLAGPVPRLAADSALVTFTSGSSGTPKGADRTHGFLAAQHLALKAEFPYADDDVDMPMFPVFALNNLASGITSVVPDMDFRRVAEVDAAVIAAQMMEHGVGTVTASPPFFDRLAAWMEQAPAAGRPVLRRLLTGGAPVSDAQLRRWQSAFPGSEIIVAYGSTEAEPVAHVSLKDRLRLADSGQASKGYCAGHPVAAIRCRIIRITRGPVVLGAAGWSEWELPAGEIGELVVGGAHVCQRYYRNPAAAAENKILDAAGMVWHRMGDTGWFDRAGRFWLAGRVHSTIFRDGQVWHAQLVEQAAQAMIPAGQANRCAVIGIPDAALGEQMILVFERYPDTAAAGSRPQDLTALRGIPFDDIVFLGQPFPTDPRHNSKIDYQALRQRLQQAQGKNG